MSEATAPSALAAFKTRAEKATRWQQEYDQTKSDTAAIMTVHAAGQSSADVPRLLAALEAIEAKLAEEAAEYRATVIRMNEASLAGTYEGDPLDEIRYNAYTARTESMLHQVRQIISRELNA